MVKSPIIHRLFLLVAAAVTLHGTVSLMFWDGVFHTEPLRSYTVQTNLLLVVGFVVMAFLGASSRIRPYLHFAVLICISVTGIVYNLILVPFGGAPMVLDGWGNFVTHLLSMLLAWANYLLFEKKQTFLFRHIWAAIVPTFAYWLVFVSIGSAINWFPYFFMNPYSVGWGGVFFWFAVILVFLVGLTVSLVLFDNGRWKKAGAAILVALLTSALLVLIFGDRQPRTLVTLSYEIGDVAALRPGDSVAFATVLQREDGLAVAFAVSIDEPGTHLLNYLIYSPGMEAAFSIVHADTGAVVHQSRGSEHSGVNEQVELSEGDFIVSWTFPEGGGGMAHIHFWLRK
jgi:hypothetical protein